MADTSQCHTVDNDETIGDTTRGCAFTCNPVTLDTRRTVPTCRLKRGYAQMCLWLLPAVLAVWPLLLSVRSLAACVTGADKGNGFFASGAVPIQTVGRSLLDGVAGNRKICRTLVSSLSELIDSLEIPSEKDSMNRYEIKTVRSLYFRKHELLKHLRFSSLSQISTLSSRQMPLTGAIGCIKQQAAGVRHLWSSHIEWLSFTCTCRFAQTIAGRLKKIRGDNYEISLCEKGTVSKNSGLFQEECSLSKNDG